MIKKIAVISVESPLTPCPQVRLVRPFSYLKDRWSLVWGVRDGKLLVDEIKNADLLLLQRATPGMVPLSVLQEIFSLGKPVIYESDDLLNEMPDDHPEIEMVRPWKEGIEYAIMRCHAVVTSTQFLAEKYRKLNANVHVVPNYLDVDLFYKPAQIKNGNKPVTIGLLGSSIMPSNFAIVEKALRTLLDTYGDRINIHFVGWKCPEGWENVPGTQFFPFILSYEEYAAQLKKLDWDIALTPLTHDDFNSSKSPVKWFDYSAAGIATIFSDAPVYRSVVTHNETGLLLPESHDAWLTHITTLIESPEKRYALAKAAQDAVKQSYDLKEHSSHYDRVYGNILQGTPNTTDAVKQASPTAMDESRIPAILLLSPLGDPQAITSTLDQLAMFLPTTIKIVILTTGENISHAIGSQAQYITVQHHSYAETLSKLLKHEAFHWLKVANDTQTLTQDDIPELKSHQSDFNNELASLIKEQATPAIPAFASMLKATPLPGPVSAQRRMHQTTTPIYLHLGCGDRKINGFVNIDATNPAADIKLDPTRPLPWKQGSVAGIYHAHLIEKLSRAQCIGLLRECRRILAPGGVLRIATQDLRAVVEQYLQETPANLLNTELSWTANNAERLNIAMRWSDRQWLYDEEDLTHLARLAGLEYSGKRSVNESQHQAFQGCDQQDASLIMEFIKPDRQPDMANPPLVSILIPSYHSGFFREALESAINQTYRNIEIIISDDCAGTEIEDIVRPYLETDPRITYLKHTSELARKDYGRSNIHDCFVLANGEYIKYLFDDDRLAPNCVERMVKAFAENPDIALVTSKRQRIDENGDYLQDFIATIAPVTEDSRIDGLSLGHALLASKINFVGEPTTAMFRKQDMLHVKPDIMGFDNHEIGGIGDVAIWMNLLTKGDAIYLTDSLSYFRTHSKQVQASASAVAEKHSKLGWEIIQAAWQRHGFLTSLT